MSSLLPLSRDENRTMHPNPIRSKFTILRQLCQLIPSHFVSKLARNYGVNKKACTFRSGSHVVSMIYAQLIQAISAARFRRWIPQPFKSSPVACIGPNIDLVKGRPSVTCVWICIPFFLGLLLSTRPKFTTKKASVLCAGINSGEIVVFDKAYLDFEFRICLSRLHIIR